GDRRPRVEGDAGQLEVETGGGEGFLPTEDHGVDAGGVGGGRCGLLCRGRSREVGDGEEGGQTGEPAQRGTPGEVAAERGDEVIEVVRGHRSVLLLMRDRRSATSGGGEHGPIIGRRGIGRIRGTAQFRPGRELSRSAYYYSDRDHSLRRDRAGERRRWPPF